MYPSDRRYTKDHEWVSLSGSQGRMGVTVTFVAILELVREGLIEIVQSELFAPLHVRAALAPATLHLVENSSADEVSP